MKEIEKMLKEKFTKFGIENIIDIADGWVIPKTTAMRMKQKRRVCHNKTAKRICVFCTRQYGSEECKLFRNDNDMKIGYIPPLPELIAKSLNA